MAGIPSRVTQHLKTIFRRRLANKATLVLRDKTGVNEYGQPIWSETHIPVYIFIRVYKARGVETTTLGVKPESNFVYTMEPITTPRIPREDDLIIIGDRKYKILNATTYTDQDGNIMAITGQARVYATGEV